MSVNLLTISILALGILCIVISVIARYKNNGCIQACTDNTTAEVIEIRESDGKKFLGKHTTYDVLRMERLCPSI